MNECCFVWGPPLSGQRYWMVRAAEDTDPETVVTLLPMENQNPQPSLEEVIANLQMQLTSNFTHAQKRHIYCELPWEVTTDATVLEEWLASRPEFQNGPNAEWNLSFVCVCAADADRLPDAYRRGMEEFARASQSGVIVVRREGDDSEIDWFDTEVLDFGRATEVFEEDLWPPASDADKEYAKHALKTDELQTITLSVSGDRTSYFDLFQDLAHGYYGPVWGAEAYWKNARGELEVLSLSQGKLFSWQSNNPSLKLQAPVNGAMLSLAGGPLRRQDLILALRSQSFC